MLKLVDTSHYNGLVDFKGIKAAGYDGAYLKATEGATNQDAYFKRSYELAKEAALLVGAYHFYEPKIDIHAQLDNFTSFTKDCDFDLPTTFDWEKEDGTSSSKQISDANIWLNYLKNLEKKTPVIYTGPSFFRDIIGSPRGFDQYHLWIANYGVSEPKIPQPWTSWKFWQYTESGKIPGVIGEFDLNWFNGTLEQLKAL